MNNYMRVIINAMKQWTNDALKKKVDVVEGKGLSTEDFTTEYKEKLDSLAPGSGGGSGGAEVIAKDAVLYTEQSLTEEQKAQARENIGVEDILLYTEQTLTEEQKVQVRENIGIEDEIAETLLGLDILRPVGDADGALGEDGEILVIRNDDIFLPEVDAEDEGKFLKAVNGKWIADSVEIPEVDYPVTSVNGQTGDVQIEIPEYVLPVAGEALGGVKNGGNVVIDAAGAMNVEIPEVDYPVTSVNGQTGEVQIEIPEQVQVDWEQNDSTQIDFIKNRPFYSEEDFVSLANNEYTTIELSDGSRGVQFNPPVVIEDKTTYRVVVDGNEYISTAFSETSEVSNGVSITVIYLGNLGLSGDTNYEDTGENFAMVYADLSPVDPDAGIQSSIILAEPLEKVTISIEKYDVVYHTLDENFIPNSIARKTDVFWTTETIEVLFSQAIFGPEYQEEVDFQFVEGKQYTLKIDGVSTDYIAYKYEYDDIIIVGDLENGPVAYVDDYYNTLYIKIPDEDLHSIEILGTVEHYHFNEKFAKNSQSNWEESDETSVSYIKNRPFYTYKEDNTTLFQDMYEVINQDGMYGIDNIPLAKHPILGETYTVFIRGLGTATSVLNEYYSIPYLGNINILNDEYDGSGQNFLIIFDDEVALLYSRTAISTSTSYSYNAYVSGPALGYKTIEEKYLPDSAKVKPNWSENSTTSPNYIYNRTHWLENGTLLTQEPLNINFDTINTEANTVSAIGITGIPEFKGYTTYTVIWNNKTYILESVSASQSSVQGTTSYYGTDYLLGNTSLLGNIDNYYSQPENKYPELPFVFYFTKWNNGLKGFGGYVQGTTPIEAQVQFYEGIHKYYPLDKHYLPEEAVQRDSILDKIFIQDKGNGAIYILYMYNGEMIIAPECTKINVTTMPYKTNYWPEEEFNPDGMIVKAIYSNGSEKEISDYTYTVITESSNTKVVVTYEELGKTYTTFFLIIVENATMAETLIDFDYTVNDDDTITLNSWKGTNNGISSTYCIIPQTKAAQLKV